jgi:hypothetical protein
MANDTEMPGKSDGAIVILNVPTLTRRTRPVSKKPKRLHARAVKRILDRETGALVGWLYEWNTGELVPRWKSGAQSEVVFV